MTVHEDLKRPHQQYGQRPGSMYRGSPLGRDLKRAVIVDYLDRDENVDDIGDAVSAATDRANQLPEDSDLWMRFADVNLLPGGSAVRVTHYQPLPRRGYEGPGAPDPDIRNETEPRTITMEWFTQPGTSTVITVRDPDEGHDIPRPWQRQFEILHIMIPVSLSSNPIPSIDDMIGKTNNADFTIDGVTYGENELRFDAPNIWVQGEGSDITYDVIYHYMAKPIVTEAPAGSGGWVRQRLDDLNPLSVAYEDLFERTTFSTPPTT